MREIVFDTETTGLDPRTGDRMVEIGCIEVMNRVPTGSTFHAYFHPGRLMPSEAEAVHGLSDVFLSDKPPFGHRVADLLAFLEDSPLVAHNAGFDFAFLDAELGLCGHPPVCRSRMVDTVALARVRHPGAKLSLDALCTRYGIDRSHRVLHGALLDAELLAQVYIELRGGRQIGLELATAPLTGDQRRSDRDGIAGAGIIGGGMAGFVAGLRGRVVRAARRHAASVEELAAHAAFLKTIDAPMWGEIGVEMPPAAGE